MSRLLLPFVSVLLVAVAGAQITHVIPDGMANAAGGTANAFPWGTSAGSWPGLRILACYDSTNFTNASITNPILITGLRWRANDTSQSWTGGTYSLANISLSTAAVDVSGVTTQWASNHGNDLTLCYSGPVTVQPGTGNGSGVPGPFHVDVTLTTPFTYDPAQGDLAIDTDYANPNFVGGGLVSMDIDNSGAGRASRVYGSSQYPNANGTTQNHGIVVEVSYLPVGGNVALSTTYGDGCYDYFSSFYETFPAGTFDLSNTGITLAPTGTGYVVVPAATGFYTPTTAPLALSTNQVTAALGLGFTLPYPGGSTSAVFASSNGFVWAQASTTNGCCNGNASTLLSDFARWCPLWTDLNPATMGTVHFDVDPASNAAYLTFTNVPENGINGNTNTFQVAFFDSGVVEFRYQACAVTNHTTLVGWSPGGGARNPGSVDLSAALPIVTAPDTLPLSLSTMGRPIIGTGVVVTASDVPSNSSLGAFVGGLTQMNPGLDLGTIGMPDCRQYLSLDSALVFVPTAGSASFTFNVPNDQGLNGVHVFLQAAALSAGVNQLGALSSNGVDLKVGLQ